MNRPLATIFLVDDDHSVRHALGRLFRSAGFDVRPFAAAREFLDSDLSSAGAACVVLDLQLPELHGLDLQQELKARDVRLPIVFVTGHGDVSSSVRAMKAGAVDFLTKPVEDEDLLRAVQEALQQHESERVRRDEIDALQARAANLTPRERQVMELVVKGLLNKQIAARLGTSEKTVKVHRGRVMRKMQVASLADLVRASARLGEVAKLRVQREAGGSKV